MHSTRDKDNLVTTGASNFVLGNTIRQKQDDTSFQPVESGSGDILGTEKNHQRWELKLLGVIWRLENFRSPIREEKLFIF